MNLIDRYKIYYKLWKERRKWEKYKREIEKIANDILAGKDVGCGGKPIWKEDRHEPGKGA